MVKNHCEVKFEETYAHGNCEHHLCSICDEMEKDSMLMAKDSDIDGTNHV